MNGLRAVQVPRQGPFDDQFTGRTSAAPGTFVMLVCGMHSLETERFSKVGDSFRVRFTIRSMLCWPATEATTLIIINVTLWANGLTQSVVQSTGICLSLKPIRDIQNHAGFFSPLTDGTLVV